jgi:hypothetical protein
VHGYCAERLAAKALERCYGGHRFVAREPAKSNGSARLGGTAFFHVRGRILGASTRLVRAPGRRRHLDDPDADPVVSRKAHGNHIPMQIGVTGTAT